MRVDIAVRAAAANAFLQTPDQRKIRIHDPILRIAGVVMENVTDAPSSIIFFACAIAGMRR